MPRRSLKQIYLDVSNPEFENFLERLRALLHKYQIRDPSSEPGREESSSNLTPTKNQGEPNANET